MKLTTRCRYGTRAMAEIASNYGIRPTTKKEIARNQDIPDSYLENILVDLKKDDLIITIRGAKGGYELSKSPEKISVHDIVDSLGGGLEPVDCLKKSDDCNRADICSARNIWKELQEAQESVLKRYTLADLTGGNYK